MLLLFRFIFAKTHIFMGIGESSRWMNFQFLLLETSKNFSHISEFRQIDKNGGFVTWLFMRFNLCVRWFIIVSFLVLVGK